MRRWLKRGASLLLIPLTKWYLRKERRYKRHEIEVRVPPGVFHPGLFYSTQFLASYLLEQSLVGKHVLELGCGSGFLSILCAKQGAHVTATDISSAAVEATQKNSKLNHLKIELVRSDLFQNVPPQRFDWIIINPPYYPQTPQTDADHAWFCGEEFQYFHLLFESIRGYLHSQTEIVMVLTQGCDLSTIISIAEKNKFTFELIREQNVLFDGKDFIYRIKATATP